MSPRTEEENLRIREEQKQRIHAAAAKVFARKGLAAAKISDIAAEADVSYGLVYHYFKSKEDLFAFLVERAMLGAMRLFQQAETHPGTPGERLLWLTEQVLEGTRRNPASFVIIAQAYANDTLPENVRNKLLELSDTTAATCERIFAAAQAEGQIVQGDTKKLTLMYLACINGFSSGTAFFSARYISLPQAEDILRLFRP